MSIEKIKKQLQIKSSKEKAKLLQGFFKTGPGQYGQGDIFIGVTVPEMRKIAKQHKDLPLKETLILLKSPIHEQRLLALLIWVVKYSQADLVNREKIYKLYLQNTKYINNWDLVDLSCAKIIGAFLLDKDKTLLINLAKSNYLWERRIAIVTTYHFIRENIFSYTLDIAKILLNDQEDLIHKAVGWMLREVGKRDLLVEEDFLRKHYKAMPRTMLRYAIERFPEDKRIKYLKGLIV